MNLLTKLLFLIKRPQLIIVTGNGRASASEAIFQVLKEKASVKKIRKINLKNILTAKFLIIDRETKDIDKTAFFIQKSKSPILVITAVGEIPANQTFFASSRENVKNLANLAKNLPSSGYLILNFDDETVREIKDNLSVPCLTFGLQKHANLQASDIKTNTGVNFKINYKGNIVPVWLRNIFGKEQVYSALSAVGCAVKLGMNLVEVSQALQSFRSVPGKMRLIQGNKNSQILDDSQNASSQSMLEALEVLSHIQSKRKIAVLGDILAVGKYAMQAHETIGERTSSICDILFTVGSRAKFIKQGALRANMPKERIFEFDEPEIAARALEQKIQQGDLILVDGAKEMKMAKVVEEIKKY